MTSHHMSTTPDPLSTPHTIRITGSYAALDVVASCVDEIEYTFDMTHIANYPDNWEDMGVMEQDIWKKENWGPDVPEIIPHVKFHNISQTEIILRMPVIPTQALKSLRKRFKRNIDIWVLD